MVQAVNDPVIDRIEIVDQPEETMLKIRSPKGLLSIALLIGLLSAFLLIRRARK